MSRIHKRSDYEPPYEKRILRIKPEGWTADLTFEYGQKHMCGQAEDGIYTYLNNEAGGVMTLDDLVAMRDMINDHLASVLYRKASPDSDALTPIENDEEQPCNCGKKSY